MYIALTPRRPFAFAGLYEDWRSPTGEVLRSCAIVTTTRNAVVERLHERMPVILEQAAESVWLDPTTDDPELLARVLVPYPAEEMEAYAVSTLVNSPANEPLSRARFKANSWGS